MQLKEEYKAYLSKRTRIDNKEFEIILSHVKKDLNAFDVVVLATRKLHHPSMNSVGRLNFYTFLTHPFESDAYQSLNELANQLFQKVFMEQYKEKAQDSVGMERFEKLAYLMHGSLHFTSFQSRILLDTLLSFHGLIAPEIMEHSMSQLSRKVMYPSQEDRDYFINQIKANTDNSKLVSIVKSWLE